MTARLALIPLLLVAALASCTPAEDGCDDFQTETGPTMRPGDNCLSCHQDGFGDDAPEWTAAGTVFASADSDFCEGVAGVKIYLTAADGSEIELVTNEAGNFYTNLPLAVEGPGPRIEYEGRTRSMSRDLPPLAACNACHSDPPVGGAPGRIFVP